MLTFTSPRTRSALTSHELAALGALMHGGGTVAEFHVSLLTRILRGAQAWHHASPAPSAVPDRHKKHLARTRHRVSRFLPVAPAAESEQEILSIKDPRELLDDYALLAAAIVAAQAHGPLDSTDAVGQPDHGARVLTYPTRWPGRHERPTVVAA